jgi:hypothetical protein
MSSSSPADLRAWGRERFQLRRFGPLALVLALAASAGAGRPRVERLGRDALLALLLLLQFRLWDDLADLPWDRVDHPARVLCRAATHGPFRAAIVGFAGASALLLARPSGHRQPPALAGLLGFAALNAGFFAWYAGPGRRHSGTALGAHIVILKYPAFVALLRGSDRPADAAFGLACAGVYLALCAHEHLDDERLRGARRRP